METNCCLTNKQDCHTAAQKMVPFTCTNNFVNSSGLNKDTKPLDCTLYLSILAPVSYQQVIQWSPSFKATPPAKKNGRVREVTSLERNNLVVFYYLKASDF
jgi:hypothetical protein